MFVENGHDRNHLYSLIREYKRQTPKTENTDSNIVKLPWIPIIGPKIRKELRKTQCKAIFKTKKLKNILYNNESLPNSYPGVYELSCDCGREYIGETKKCVINQLNTKKIALEENG